MTVKKATNVANEATATTTKQEIDRCYQAMLDAFDAKKYDEASRWFRNIADLIQQRSMDEVLEMEERMGLR